MVRRTASTSHYRRASKVPSASVIWSPVVRSRDVPVLMLSLSRRKVLGVLRPSLGQVLAFALSDGAAVQTASLDCLAVKVSDRHGR